MNFLGLGGTPKPKQEDIIEVNRDLSVKTLFAQEFGLTDLDLLETVGTGTFGRIRVVKSLVDKKYYALKMMKKARIVRLKQLLHIQSELKLMATVRCDFIPELYAFFQDDNSIYFLMTYIPGGELFSHLRRQEYFELGQYQFYAVEIACCLYTLHELNIAYRDIKPENILINKEGHIRLIDFGIAKFLDDSNDKTFTLCGTPEYLAPEVIKGEGHGCAVDWWCLGVLIYEMAFGYPPFYGKNPFTVYSKILSGTINFPTKCPKTTKSIIKNLCNSNRSSRLGSGRGGFSGVTNHSFFSGVEWRSAARQLMVPPIVPLVLTDGDTSNYDFYGDELAEESSNLTLAERQLFREFEEILERKPLT
jgi:serine/threonine protein kinase